MKLSFFILLISISTTVFSSAENPLDCAASGADKGSLEKAIGCPRYSDITKIQGLCRGITESELSNFGEKRMYLYEKMIYEASCGEPTDSKDVLFAKAQQFWNSHRELLTCENGAFGSKKNVLKYAVKMKTLLLLKRAAKDWQIDLNYADNSDQLTILDYVDVERKRLAGTEDAHELDNTYEILLSAGAKHSSGYDIKNKEYAQK